MLTDGDEVIAKVQAPRVEEAPIVAAAEGEEEGAEGEAADGETPAGDGDAGSDAEEG